MKYKVVGVYRYEETVDTEDPNFQIYKNSAWGKYAHSKKELVENYVKRLLSWNIVDDEGHGTLYPSSFDWTVEKIAE